MKPVLEKINVSHDCSFSVKKDVLPYIDTPWHYHPEYELVYIEKSHGKRFVGDSVDNFSAGDLAFLGPGLPHVWKNDDVFYKNIPELKAIAWVIHFNENVFGCDFFNLPEMASIKHVLKSSVRGLLIKSNEANKIAAIMKNMLEEMPVKRVTLLIEILSVLAHSKHLNYLASEGFTKSFSHDSDKLNLIFDYICTHFRDEIELDKLAAIGGMSKTSFCRFFKAKTKKTFSQFLNEIRLGYAKKLLMEGRLNVNQIGYECGYNNPSYFNRQFKQLEELTPLEFQMKHSAK